MSPSSDVFDKMAAEPLWGQDADLRPYGLDPDQGPAAGSVPVSVTVIVLNEEAHLEACLRSLAFAQDVVVVDAMSTDRSAEIARRCGARVYTRPWPGFTAQRNYSLAQCRFDWVLSVDADERVSLRLAQSLARLMAAPPALSAYRVPELNNYFGRWLRHGGIYPGYHISLFDRRCHSYASGPGDVHEDIHADLAGTLQGPMLHLAYPSFHLALQKLNAYTDLEARSRIAQGRRVRAFDLLRRPVGRFFSNYVLKRGFLDGIEGFLYCALTSLYALSYSVKVWELQRRRPPAGMIPQPYQRVRQALGSLQVPSSAAQRRSNSAAPASSSGPRR